MCATLCAHVKPNHCENQSIAGDLQLHRPAGLLLAMRRHEAPRLGRQLLVRGRSREGELSRCRVPPSGCGATAHRSHTCKGNESSEEQGADHATMLVTLVVRIRARTEHAPRTRMVRGRSMARRGTRAHTSRYWTCCKQWWRTRWPTTSLSATTRWLGCYARSLRWSLAARPGVVAGDCIRVQRQGCRVVGHSGTRIRSSIRAPPIHVPSATSSFAVLLPSVRHRPLVAGG